MIDSFKNFSLSTHFQRALEHLGFTTPTEIQSKAIPMLLEAKAIDFHGQAQTGTGKTLAFGIPLLHKIDTSVRKPQALIVAPTRELVLQICDALKQVAQFSDIVIVPIYGGVPIMRQLQELRSGVHIVVGTPGRLNDHIRRGTLSLDALTTLVLDEADIMLDMGFREEIDEILNFAPASRQIWLFSATVKPGIESLKKQHMKDPISIRVSRQQVSAPTTQQFYCVVPSKLRLSALCRFIDKAEDFYGVVFCQTKMLAGEVAEALSGRGYAVNALHGDMDQKLRNVVIKKFKNKEFTILVATDVAARGIDVSGLTYVINYSLPEDQESYVHRVGRTGRAGKEGCAITLINRSDVRRIAQMAQRFNAEIKAIEVPRMADVVEARSNQAIAHLQKLAAQVTSNEATKVLRANIEKLTTEQLVDGLVNVLSATFLKGYTDEKEISFSSGSGSDERSSYRDRGGDRQSYHGGGIDSDKQEIVIHGGSDDGITNQDVLDYCVSGTVPRASIDRIRVIKKRSFVIVSSAVASILVDELKNKDLVGRRVRVAILPAQEMSDDGGYERRPYREQRFGNDDRFGGQRRRSGGNDRGGDRYRSR